MIENPECKGNNLLACQAPKTVEYQLFNSKQKGNKGRQHGRAVSSNLLKLKLQTKSPGQPGLFAFAVAFAVLFVIPEELA